MFGNRPIRYYMKNLPVDVEEFLDYLKDTYKCKPEMKISKDLRDDLKKIIQESLSIPKTSPWSNIFYINMEVVEISYHGSYKNRNAIIYDIKYNDPTRILENVNSKTKLEFNKNYLEIKEKLRELKNKCFPITIIEDD